MKIKEYFNESQLDYLKSNNVEISDKEYTDDEILEIDSKVDELLVLNTSEPPSVEMLMCESILDIIAEL